MRIVEVRRFNEQFAVYVNTANDIAILEKDKRFKLLTTYYARKCLLGKEYLFNYRNVPCTEVQKWLRANVLNKVVVTQTKPVPIKDTVQERCIFVQHKKPRIMRKK